MRLLLFLLLFVFFGSCNDNSKQSTKKDTEATNTISIINYTVKNVFSHDTSLFTEGLLVHDGRLFESTGSPQEFINTKSLVGIVDLKTGIIDKKIELDRTKYFGEGIVILKDKLYQLTYESQVGFIYDTKTFKQIGHFNFSNKEGWGLTTNGIELIMSDGTENLTFLEPNSLKAVRKLSITENGVPVKYLNELEFINGFIYSNIWNTNFIIKIEPLSGSVVGKLDLSSLVMDAKNKNTAADVLNGIAYDSISKNVYVTGKFWSNIYQIDFVL